MVGVTMGQWRLAAFGGTCVILISATLFTKFSVISSNSNGIPLEPAEVANWALRFGQLLGKGSVEATSLNTIRENFGKLGATVEPLNGKQIIEEIKADVEKLLYRRRFAVERIALAAEFAVSQHHYDKNIKYDYYKNEVTKEKDDDDEDDEKDNDGVLKAAGKCVNSNAKSRCRGKIVKDLDLETRRNFANAPVNLKESSIHVPTNVYHKDPDVLNAVKWSDYVTNAFRSNLQFDPSLNWQYFGSNLGFLRVFPATTWVTEGKRKPDFYDCRTRPWYIQAASSSKDIVILVDGSGSMAGIRKQIAKNVVKDILNTLSEDDFVTILRFADVTEPIEECFEDTLVQANDENIRRFMEDMSQMSTANIANFSVGLTTAFELLQKYNNSDLGSQCNQAIMLITDGAPNTYEDVFTSYNYPNYCVRVFTYLIGKEVTEYREVHWMACHNKGVFTHVATLPEVRDQVQKYVPIMSRPVSQSIIRPFIWTSVYADVPATELTVYEWRDREHERMHRRLNDMRIRKWHRAREDPDTEHLFIDTTAEPRRKHKRTRPLQLMTTVATPVFDRKSGRSGNLLGVAGIDVPTAEIIKHTKPYKIGVNAYTFAITNNGYILFHPQHNPLYHDLLKPGYRNIDLTMVELEDVDAPLYEYDENENLIWIRNHMIDRESGSRKMAVRIPTDHFKRVVTRNNSYYFRPLDFPPRNNSPPYSTPFSLAVVLPEPYGRYRVKGSLDVKNVSKIWSDYFSGNNWRLHPEWVYCEILQNDDDDDRNGRVEDDISEWLSSKNFTWGDENPPKLSEPTCEKDLIASLLFDGKATLVDPPNPEDEVVKSLGIVTTFVATRSGLTRYEDYRPISETANSTERPIYETHRNATDEDFYKRAVDFHQINSSAFVFSVPFNAGDKMTTLVTGSHALFLSNGTRWAAPAAVVGLQFNHSVFADIFFETTSECKDTPCSFKCDDEELDCYLLDNNGFIVVSENPDHTGKFFGEIDYTLFESMIENGVYKRVHVYDYQAVCLEVDPSYGFSPFLLTPFHHLKNIFTWFWSKVVLFYIHLSMYEWWSESFIVSASDYEYEDDYDALSNTIPRACKTELDLYEMLPLNFEDSVKGRLPPCKTTGCDKHFLVQPVPYTNLVILIVDSFCSCETVSVSLKPKEVTQNETLKCFRMQKNMHRRRPSVCFGCQAKENEMNYQCGGCSRLSAVTISTLLLTFITSHIITQYSLFV